MTRAEPTPLEQCILEQEGPLEERLEAIEWVARNRLDNLGAPRQEEERDDTRLHT